MDIKKVVATFILTGLLLAGSSYYYAHGISEKKKEIETLEVAQELRDSEIARLKDVVKGKDEDIKKSNLKLNEKLKLVEERDLKINTQSELIDKQKEIINNQKVTLENNKKKEAIEKQKNKVNSSTSKGDSNKVTNKVTNTKSGGRKLNVQVTAYGADCNGCSGITATGVDVRNTTTYQGMRVIATDPNVIPLYSIVNVDVVGGISFKAIALDTGGAIKGNIIDYLMGSERETISFGRQKATITILREGKG